MPRGAQLRSTPGCPDETASAGLELGDALEGRLVAASPRSASRSSSRRMRAALPDRHDDEGHHGEEGEDGR